MKRIRIMSALLCAVLLCGMVLPAAAAQLKSGETMVELTGSVKASALEQADAYFVQGKTALELDRAVEAREIEGGPDAELTIKGKESLTLEDLTCGSLIIEGGDVNVTGRLFITGQLTLKGGTLRADSRMMADYLLLNGGRLEAEGGVRLFVGLAQSGGEAFLGQTRCDGNMTISGGSLTVTAEQAPALTCAKEISLSGGSLWVQAGSDEPNKPDLSDPDQPGNSQDPTENTEYDTVTPVAVKVGPGVRTSMFTMIGGALDVRGTPALQVEKRLAVYTPAVVTLPEGGKAVKVTPTADQGTELAAWFELRGSDGLSADHVTVGMDQNAVRFTDVPERSYYRVPVAWAVSAGISNGTSRTTYSPNQAVTRALVVNFLWKYVGSPEPKSLKTDFTDVNDKTFGYKAILWAVEQKIIQGVSSTRFQPDGLCSREQTILILHRFRGSPKPQSTNSPFRDVKMNTSTTGAVLWAIENGITVGTTPTTFRPDTTCTRAMLTTFLYRLDRLG